MRKMAILALAAAGVATAAQAEPRPLSGFTRVSAESGIEVQIAVGPNFSVDVSGRDADRIATRVSGGVLHIEPQSRLGWGRREALVRISMPRIEGLEASSGARVRAQGLNGADVIMQASSGAQLSAAGRCGVIGADASSGANLDASALACEAGTVEASSGARTSVNVDGRLNVEASSGGNVYVSGTPEMGDISLSSGGALHRR